MAETPILYSFRRCPYAMRARMALVTSGVTCRLREVVLRQKPAEMLAASPKGTVPVLVLPAGQVIDESLEIMLWALSRSDPEGWLRSAGDPLIADNDGAFKAALDRYKYPTRYAGADPMTHRAAGLLFLEGLERRLATQQHLGCDDRTLVDVAIFPFVRQFAEVDRGWFDALPLPALRDWLARQLASPLFAAAMTRYAPWRAGEPEPVFPAEKPT